jgi:hypothetical protein
VEILLIGCGTLDDLRVWVHPLEWGKGEHIFNNASGLPTLKLMDTKIFSSGVVVHEYQPVKK